MSAAPTRFGKLSALPARALLLALAGLIALGLTVAPTPPAAPKPGAAGRGDAALYRAIIRDTATHGATPAAYYHAAAAEQRAQGYPLRPFVTMREPALALISAWIGAGPLAWLYRLLTLAATAVLAWRVQRDGPRAERLLAVVCATIAVVVLAQPVMALWHEAWAALLLVPALVGGGGRRWPIACLAGLAALLVRELAAPAIVALLFAACAGRRRAEAASWSIVMLSLAVALAAHAHAVAAVVLPNDLGSPGWARFGGWGFILAIARGSSALALLPGWAVALAVPLALFGWAGRGGAFADRVALALVATIVPFMAIGRPDNVYWGLMLAPLLPVGLAFAPRALADLVRSARQAAPASPWSAAWTADASS